MEKDEELRCEECSQAFKTPQALASHKKFKHPDKQVENELGDQGSLPVTLKVGQGREMISPEAILKQYLLGDGDAGKWMLKGMMMLRAAQMMVLTDVEIMKGQADAQAKAIQPILSLMEKSREDMDAAAQRAKESNKEIADRAAAMVGAQIMPEVEALKTQMASSGENPMEKMMTILMTPAFQKAGQQIAQLFTKTQPGVQPEQPEQPEQPAEDGQPPQPGNPPNIEEHPRAEFEED